MKIVFIIAWVLLFNFPSSFTIAQSKKIDSLKEALRVSDEHNRYEALWGLAYELYDVDNPQALIYAKRAHSVALEKGDTLNIVKSGCILGQLLRRTNSLDESIRALASVLLISERHGFVDLTNKILNALAISYTYKAEYDKALGYHFKSLAIREKTGDKKEISISFNNIGMVYRRLKNIDLALDYFKRSLKAKEESNDKFDLDQLLINIGLCYIDLSDYQTGRKFIDKGFKVCSSSCSNQLIINGEYGLGETFFHQGNLDLATMHFKKSLSISLKEFDLHFQFDNLLKLTAISLLQNDLRNAKTFLNNADLLPGKKQYQELLIRYYKLNADLYSQSKDFRKANMFQKMYSELRDSVYDAEMFKKISNIQTQYAERYNLASIESKSKVISLQQEAILRQRLLNLAISSVALLIMGLSLVLYKINKQKQKINGILDQRVKERTLELEKNRDELVHAHNEQMLVLRKVTSDLTSSLATIRGLSNTATKDLPQEQAIYFKEAEATAERLVNYVNKYTMSDLI